MKALKTVMALLLTLQLSGCFLMAIFGVQDEPHTSADCEKYKAAYNHHAACKSYVSAQESFAQGEYSDAEYYLRRSGLDAKEWGKAFKVQIEAEVKRAVTPDELDAAAVKSIDIDATSICPGATKRVQLVAELKDGTIKRTWTKSDKKAGFVDFENFTVKVSHGTWNAEKGSITAGSGLPGAVTEGVQVEIQLAGNKSIKATKTLMPTFECRNVINVSGHSGNSGSYGGKGQSRSGSLECGGRPGGRGGNGSYGRHGGNGSDVLVDVSYVDTKHSGKVIIAVAKTSGGTYWAGAPAKKGSITVVSHGGNGGHGGQGGQGGDGERSFDSCGGGSVGDAGVGGHGGDGGSGGNGGNVKIRINKRHKTLAKRIKTGASAGSAGSAGGAGSGGCTGASTCYSSSNDYSGQAGSAGRHGRAGSVRLEKVSGKSLFKGMGLIAK